MDPERLFSGDPRLADVLALIQSVFAEHDGRVDPPSSMHRITLADLETAAQVSEVWVAGTPPIACVILSVKGYALYLSKLAVKPSSRGTGLARRLVMLAEARAHALGLHALELQTRTEWTENHATFRKLGFEKIAETAHPGFDRPTSITMRKGLTRSPNAHG